MPNKLNNVLAERLPELMEEAKVSRKDLAEFCGVSYNTARCWVLGAKTPRPDKMMKIAQLFNLNAVDLMAPAFEDSASQPVRFLPQILQDGTLEASQSADSFGSLASGVDADYVYIMPDNSMDKADVIEGDICLIRKSSALKHGIPTLIKYKGCVYLRFVVFHPSVDTVSIRTACPYSEAVLFATEDFKRDVTVIGHIVAFRRNYRKR